MVVLGLHHSTLRSSRYFISIKSKRRQRKRWRSQGTDSGPVVRLIVVRPDVVAPKDRADEEAASAELWRWSGLRFQVWKAKDSQIQNLYFQHSLNSFWNIKGRKITEEKNATFFQVKLTSHLSLAEIEFSFSYHSCLSQLCGHYFSERYFTSNLVAFDKHWTLPLFRP